jgi:hypothetical protein
MALSFAGAASRACQGEAIRMTLRRGFVRQPSASPSLPLRSRLHPPVFLSFYLFRYKTKFYIEIVSKCFMKSF